MKKGQIIEGIVQRMDFPNKGVVETQDGDICIVKNALPGQKVRCSINKVRKGKAEGRLLDIIEPSLVETGSPCPHFGECGGCLYLSFPYEEQLKIKEMQVKKLLDQVLCKQENYEFEGIKASPICYGYRNKMEFSLKSVGNQFLVAQPGIELDAKKNRITQKAMFEKTTANDWITVSFDFGAVLLTAAVSTFPRPAFSCRRNMSTTA